MRMERVVMDLAGSASALPRHVERSPYALNDLVHRLKNMTRGN